MPCLSGNERMEIKPLTKEQIARGKEIERIEKLRKTNLSNYSPIEKEAFNSFMTVFLCKAMDLIASNNLMQHTYHEMEWWWKEHKYRDNNNNKASDGFTQKKLVEIQERYKVE